MDIKLWSTIKPGQLYFVAKVIKLPKTKVDSANYNLIWAPATTGYLPRANGEKSNSLFYSKLIPYRSKALVLDFPGNKVDIFNKRHLEAKERKKVLITKCLVSIEDYLPEIFYIKISDLWDVDPGNDVMKPISPGHPAEINLDIP